jgi:hypothetical protein
MSTTLRNSPEPLRSGGVLQRFQWVDLSLSKAIELIVEQLYRFRKQLEDQSRGRVDLGPSLAMRQEILKRTAILERDIPVD